MRKFDMLINLLKIVFSFIFVSIRYEESRTRFPLTFKKLEEYSIRRD